MCGNCLLQETAFICPMECPKGARNGPCGGSTAEHCYVDETRPCIWYKIYDRAFQHGPRRKCCWKCCRRSIGTKSAARPGAMSSARCARWARGKVVRGCCPATRRSALQHLGLRLPPGAPARLVAGRQPVPRPAYTEPVSELERRLKAGEFVVTAEVAPPISAKTDKMLQEHRHASSPTWRPSTSPITPRPRRACHPGRARRLAHASTAQSR